jgi:hypothetical protein
LQLPFSLQLTTWFSALPAEGTFDGAKATAPAIVNHAYLKVCAIMFLGGCPKAWDQNKEQL